jgi:hypothetical protein
MRQHRILMLCVGAIMMTGCSDEATTGVNARPPLAGVRFINALADTFDIDIRPQDGVGPYLASASRLAYRSATEHQPTEAGARHFRMFPQPGPDGADPTVVSQVLVDTTITFEANASYTVLVTGSARNNTEKFVVIRDDVGDVPAGSIALRAINAATGAVSVYITNAVGDALPATPTFASVASEGASAYVTRAAGNAAARSTDAGGATVTASVAGPKAAAPPSGSPPSTVFPAGGVDAAGSALSVVYFPASVAGSKAKAFSTPGLVFFLDKHPPR